MEGIYKKKLSKFDAVSFFELKFCWKFLVIWPQIFSIFYHFHDKLHWKGQRSVEFQNLNFLIFYLILMLFFTKCKVMSYLWINTKNELLWFYRNWAKCGWNSEILHTWKMYTIYVLHLILTCFNQCFFFLWIDCLKFPAYAFQLDLT